jgi:hypothetical protein
MADNSSPTPTTPIMNVMFEINRKAGTISNILATPHPDVDVLRQAMFYLTSAVVDLAGLVLEVHGEHSEMRRHAREMTGP